MRARLRPLAPHLLLTAVAGLALSPLAWRGWIPHDEGLLAQCAERLLAGELPHRDFFDAYTGGLTALHAAAFRALGVSLGSLRWVLLVAVLSMVPALYALAARAVPPAWAVLVAATALAWGPAVYFAPLPTWYTTILAVHATWCLLRHAETGRRGWLLAAGVLGGLAITVKVVGLYQVAAALLFLLLLARTGGPQAGAAPAAPHPSRWLERLAAPVAAVCLGALVVATVWRRIGLWPLVVLVAPATVGAAALALRRPVRPAPLLGPAAWYLAGLALPVGALAAVYAAHGALGALVEGVFVAPARRLDLAAMDLEVSPLALPLAAGWAAAGLARAPTAARGRVATLCAAVFSLWIVALGAMQGPYQLAWSVVQLVGPAAAVVAAIALSRWDDEGQGGDEDRARVRGLFLVATTAGLVGLVQFPYSFGVYLAYTAPLVALAGAHVAGRAAPALRPAHGVVAAGLLLFALVWVDGAFVRVVGVKHLPGPPLRALDLPRAGGLLVPAADADAYEEVARLVAARTAPGDAILALPDCPEVYFLAARRNPTVTMYDAFDDDFGAPATRAARLGALVDDVPVRLAVLGEGTEFSGAPHPASVAAIVSRLPAGAQAGPFRLVWAP